MFELEACCLRGMRQHSLAGKKNAGHFAEKHFQRDGRDWKNGRPMQNRHKLARKLGVPHWSRRRCVDSPANARMLDRKQDEANLVLDVNPGHPLLASANPSSDTQSKRRKHFVERAARAEHYASPEQDHADS